MIKINVCTLLFCLLLVGKWGHIGTLGNMADWKIFAFLFADAGWGFLLSVIESKQIRQRFKQWQERKKAEIRVAQLAKQVKKDML